MRPFHASLTILVFLLASGPAYSFTHWNDIRASALLPDDTVTIRTENAQGPGLINTILFVQNGLQETSLFPVPDGPSTLEALVPGPVVNRQYYGFRLVHGDSMDLLPVRLPDGTTPGPDDLTRLAEDPLGDESFGRTHLDLGECRISRDGTRLYAALTNAGGGFPVNDGLTFFSYLLGIKDPAVSDPDTLFALIHTIDSPPIIESGLYQINGTGVNDLEKIGEITASESPALNTLLLSCELADLEANPVFQSWYDAADPRIDVAGFTQQITLLGGAQEADRTPGAVWHLREIALDPGPNQLPQLSDLVLTEPGAGGFASVVYSDIEENCPVLAEIVFDDSEVFLLRPQSLDYGGPVVYRSEDGLEPLVSGNWMQAKARFSDNMQDIVELVVTAVDVADGGSRPRFQVWPNPFSGQTEISFSLSRPQPVQLAIYDLSGRRVARLMDRTLPAGPHRQSWNGRDDAGRRLSVGLYFFHLKAKDFQLVQRLTLLH